MTVGPVSFAKEINVFFGNTNPLYPDPARRSGLLLPGKGEKCTIIRPSIFLI